MSYTQQELPGIKTTLQLYSEYNGTNILLEIFQIKKKKRVIFVTFALKHCEYALVLLWCVYNIYAKITKIIPIITSLSGTMNLNTYVEKSTIFINSTN